MRVAGSLALIAAGLALGAAAWARPDAGARLYVRPKPVVFGIWFNPQSPLFANNVALERAINYALDRPALVRAWGRYAGHPAASLIPPTVPGYDGRSAYPLAGPDLVAARALAEGNLRDGKVTLGVYYAPFLRPVAAEVKRDLAAIGLDVDVFVIAGICPHACPQPDMTFTGWGADYPDPISALQQFATPRQLQHAALLRGDLPRKVFAQIDYDVMSQAPPFAPFMAANAAMLVSARTHCFHWNPWYGVDLNALCVR